MTLLYRGHSNENHLLTEAEGGLSFSEKKDVARNYALDSCRLGEECFLTTVEFNDSIIVSGSQNVFRGPASFKAIVSQYPNRWIS